MSEAVGSQLLSFLLGVIDRGYSGRAWHGPNLRGAIRGLSAEQASWRPATGRRSIAELVLHVAYWKYAVRRRLRGGPRGKFATSGSNWFAVPDNLSENGWRQILRILSEEHRSLRDATEQYPPERLLQPVGDSGFTAAELIHEVSAHDVYHAGQIQLIKRLHASAPSSEKSSATTGTSTTIPSPKTNGKRGRHTP